MNLREIEKSILQIPGVDDCSMQVLGKRRDRLAVAVDKLDGSDSERIRNTIHKIVPLGIGLDIYIKENK